MKASKHSFPLHFISAFIIYNFTTLGGTCDGQYIASVEFAHQIAERLHVDIDDELAAPITWDASHFLNIAITDVRDGMGDTGASSAHMKRCIARCNTFNEFNRGKGYATLKIVAEEEKMTAHAPTAYAQQR